MNPMLQRSLPFIGALLAGALGYLLLGSGPRAGAARDTVPSAWALPVDAAPDVAAAASLWRDRAPWGAATATGTGAANENDQAVVPVGVIAVRGGLEALFSIPGAPLLRVRQGDGLPTGGQVTAITPSGVSWTNSKGQTRQRELFVDPDPRGPAPKAPQPRRRNRANSTSQGQ